MAVGLFFLIIVAVVVGGIAVAGASAYAANRNQSDRDIVSSLRSELKSARTSESIATKALRSIANGAGNPIMEAEIALDTINNNDIKELS